MPWCPKCNAEYIDGFTKCRSCGVDLVEQAPKVVGEVSKGVKTQSKPSSNQHVDEVLLVTTDDLAKFSYITSMLKNEGIIHWVMEQNVGQYTQIVYGLNIFGKGIYVAEHDYERAMEILSSYVPSEMPKEAYDIPADDDEQEQLERFDKKYKLAAAIVSFMFLVLLIIKLLF